MRLRETVKNHISRVDPDTDNNRLQNAWPRLSDLGFANLATVPKTVTVNITGQGITYQLNGPFCTGATGVLTHDGDITGGAILKAFVDNGTEKAIHTSQINGVHNQHEYDKLICGAQVDLFAT
jgi:hypothetical protein